MLLWLGFLYYADHCPTAFWCKSEVNFDSHFFELVLSLCASLPPFLYAFSLAFSVCFCSLMSLCNCNWCWLFDSLNVENEQMNRTHRDLVYGQGRMRIRLGWSGVYRTPCCFSTVYSYQKWQLWLVLWQFRDLNSIMTCRWCRGPMREISLQQDIQKLAAIGGLCYKTLPPYTSPTPCPARIRQLAGSINTLLRVNILILNDGRMRRQKKRQKEHTAH